MSRSRLGYLLKHATLRLTALTGRALEPYGVDGKELAVLGVLDAAEPLSQQQAAQRLRIDRTTMVALIDTLEGKGLVARRPHPGDRRNYALHLTAAGEQAMTDLSQVSLEHEQAISAPLTEAERAQLSKLLGKLASAHGLVPGIHPGYRNLSAKEPE